MYRIKTDIRQFKCDTREKVEKLIRNWVIRPTDLLYHRDQKLWAPIGDSDEFEPIFQQIKDSSEDDEETIVTAREDSPAALLDFEDDEDEDDDVEDAAARARPAAAVLRPSKNVSRKSTPKPLPIPEAPAGVEQVVRDHEVTVMTERTADLLGLSDSDEHMLEDILENVEPEELEEDSEPQLTRGDLPEELFLTNEFSASDPISAPEDSVLDELGDASSVDDGWAALSGLDENSAFEDDRATVELDVADIKLEDRRRRQNREEDDEVTVITRAPRVGGDPEPEDSPKEPSSTVFVDASYGTDDPDGPDELQDEPLLDEPLLEDLPALVSSSRRDLLSLEDLPRAVSAKALSTPDDLPAPAARPLDEGSDLPTPVADLPAPVADLPAPVADLPRPVSDLPRPVAPPEASTPTVDVGPDPLDETSDVDDLSGPDSEAIEDALDALSEISSPDEDIDEEDLPELDVEPIDDAFEDLLGGDEPEAAPFVQDRTFVSEGYQLELPYRVAPTPEDIASGVKRSTATTAQKNRAFPYPQPKKIGEVQLRYYGDKPDHSLFYVGVGVLVLILLIVTIAILMNLG